MSLQLIIGNYNYSTWSMRPWVFMRQMGLDFDTRRIPLFSDVMQEELAEFFSNFKVPVLKDDDLVIWDTLSILEYLNENYLDHKGWPEDANARAVARSVSAEMHSSFTALRNELPMNNRKRFPDYKVSEGTAKDIQRIVEIWNACRRDYAADGPWLFGRYSIADAMYAPVVMRFRSFEVALDEIGQAYFDTVCESEAVREWLAKGNEETDILEEDEIDWPSVDW